MKHLAGVVGLVVGGSFACAGGFPGSPAPSDPVAPAAPASAAAAPDPTAIVLEALSATSGGSADAVIDGDPETSWTPERDPAMEGVLLRLESTKVMSKVVVVPCPSDQARAVSVFVDGNLASGTWADGKQTVELANGAVRSVFVRLGNASETCIFDIELWGEDGALRKLAPPRRVSGTVATSSVLTPEVAYRAAYLFDQRTHFAWVEGAPGDGMGETITVTFDTPSSVRALDVWNGYQRSDDHFEKNNRAAKLRVAMDGAEPVVVDLADSRAVQRVKLPAPVKGRVLTIGIDAVTKGKKYDDLVISELRFVDDDGPYTLGLPDVQKATEARYSALENTPLDRVVGQVWGSRCGNDSLKLRPDASFVWYGSSRSELEDEEGNRSTEDVIEGAWAVEPTSGPWAKISLYARRHRIESTFRPYGESGEEESTRIAGGSLEIARASALGLEGVRAEVAALRDSTAADRVDCLGEPDLQGLVDADAVFVKGPAVTDVMVTARGR